MRKVVNLHNSTYSIRMNTGSDDSGEHILIRVIKGDPITVHSGDVMFEKKIRDSFFLNLFGLNIEKRTINKYRKILKKLNKIARKQNKYRNAIEEVESIFSLDEKMGV